MSTQNKILTVINSQMISGSGDSMRDALGFSVEGTSDQTYLRASPFKNSAFITGSGNTYTYYYRIFGNSDNVKSDKHWKAYVVGGEFDEQTYGGIYTETSFADHYHSEDVAYSLLETKINNLLESSSPNYISVQPVLNEYYQNYSNYTNDIDELTLIPNAYSFVRNNVVPVPLRPAKLRNLQREMKNTFKFEIPNGDFVYDQTGSLQQNLLFVNDKAYSSVSLLNDACSFLPQYTNMQFKFEETGQFVSDCYSNGYEYVFLRALKNSFLEQDSAPEAADVGFVVNVSYVDADGETADTSSDVEIKVVDVSEMLEFSLNNYDVQTVDFEFLLDDTEMAYSQYDTRSIRRLEKTIPALKQITSFEHFLNSYDYTSVFVDQPLQLTDKHNEVVAYRVEKLYNSEVVQNFWFLNHQDIEQFEFNDNQVAFGKTYTYNIYKYVLIAGFEYSYSGIRLSRVLGKELSMWGLEIYDPSTDLPVAPLLDSMPLRSSVGNESTIESTSKFVADFQLDIAPSIKIVEVPIFTKQVSMIDSPTNGLGVIPSYVLDDSQRLCFDVRYNLDSNILFPTPMNSGEEDFRVNFLTSYDLLEDEEFMIESKSLARTLEVYRIDYMPTSISDFDEKQILQQDLKMVDHDYAHSNVHIYSKVATNKKYYYYFRIVNEAGSPAIGSNIVEAEMVDDGGYKFAVFNVYYESELEVKPFNRPIQSFKKLLNIVPNIENLILNDEDIDYSDTSDNQIGNVQFGQSDSPVWDKTFKIRLTSKKTGKKIDINLTHKLV